MNKLNILLLVFVLFSFEVFAQKGVSAEDLLIIKKSYNKDDSYTKAVTNAVSNNSVKELVLNRQNIGKYDNEFKYKVNVKGISNQQQSGRCWMFTSMNILRYKTINDLSLSGFEFSQNYLYFWDMFEKSATFIDEIIRTKNLDYNDQEVRRLFSSVINDGGAWNYFVNLSTKYGLVPKSVMPETYSSNHTSAMTTVMISKLREDGIYIRESNLSEKQLKEAKLKMLGEIYRILAVNLGEPPSSFRWRYTGKDSKLTEYKTYTPIEFMKATVVENTFEDYVMFINDPSREYFKLYEKEHDSNLSGGMNWIFINLPIEKLKEFAAASIKDNEAMYFSCDVGKQLNKDDGLLDTKNYDYESIYGVSFKMDKRQRILSQESGSSHGMALVALDTDENDNPTKWRVENSWGSTSGDNGYLTMTDDWFNEYMFRLVVRKKYIDSETLKILKQKPIPVPAWNPAFMFDN